MYGNLAIHELCILNPKQITQSLSNDQDPQGHNRISSIHHWSWKEPTQGTHDTKQQKIKEKVSENRLRRPDASRTSGRTNRQRACFCDICGRPDASRESGRICRFFEKFETF